MDTQTHYGQPDRPPAIRLSWITNAWKYWTDASGMWIAVTCISCVSGGLTFLAVFLPVLAVYHWNFAAIPQHGLVQYAWSALSILATTVDGTLSGMMCRLALMQISGRPVSTRTFFEDNAAISSMAVVAGITSIATFIMSTAATAFFARLPSSILSNVCSTIVITVGVSIVNGFLMFAPLAIADKHMGPVEAISFSINVLKRHWPLAAGFCWVGSVFQSAGFLLCLVGALATVPMLNIAMAIGYLEFTRTTDHGAAMDDAVVWPPPPSIDEAGQATAPSFGGGGDESP